MTDAPAIELCQVSKVFANGVRAVEDVTLRIATGQVVALLGSSGSGKTTTLRLINRLEEPTTGQVLVRGHDVREQRPEVLRRSIGYIIQEGGLFPHWNVSANVATVPHLLGWPRLRVRQRVGEVLDLVGLPQARFGRRLPAELSGGQRQRVGVARALAADPELLLMDEPFGALDPGTRAVLQEEFLRLHGRLRKTVVLVTHDVAEAARLAGEIALLDQGRLVQCGSLRDLLLRPTAAPVRAFFGRQRASLALEALRLRHLLPEVPTVPPTARSLHLAPQLPLGQVLAALATADDGTTVVVDGEPGPAWAAREIRTRILADLATVAKQEETP